MHTGHRICGGTSLRPQRINLGVFMLFLAATDPFLDDEDASSIHASYFPNVCSLHIMLDYLIDQDEDRLGGDLNFCNYYEDADTMLNRIASIVEWARKDVRTIPSTPFHRMIIEGLLALYLSDPKVSEQQLVRTVSKRLMKKSPMTRIFSTSTADGFVSISMSDIEGGKETWQRLKIAVLTSGGDSRDERSSAPLYEAVCIMDLRYTGFNAVTKVYSKTTLSKWTFAA